MSRDRQDDHASNHMLALLAHDHVTSGEVQPASDNNEDGIYRNALIGLSSTSHENEKKYEASGVEPEAD